MRLPVPVLVQRFAPLCRGLAGLGFALLLATSSVSAKTVPALLTWGQEGRGPGEFHEAFGLAVGLASDVYVVDYDPSTYSRVQQFDAKGKFIRQWSGSGKPGGSLSQPRGIAVDKSNGDVFVADTGNDRIQKYNRNGQFIAEWGSWGTGAGQFRKATAIAVGPDHNVYVLDTFLNRVQAFDRYGGYETSWPILTPTGGTNSTPTGITVSPRGEVFVVDSHSQRVLKFTSAGHLQKTWQIYGVAFSSAHRPRSIAVNSLGDVLVTDDLTPEIWVSNSEGQHLFTVSVEVSGTVNGVRRAPFVSSGAVAFYQDDTVFSLESNARRVSKFRLF